MDVGLLKETYIGGSRSSISQIAAKELGISLDKVKTVIADTNSLVIMMLLMEVGLLFQLVYNN